MANTKGAPKPDWTAERVAMLREWWEVDKLTASQIERYFGGMFSRNAIIAKARRERMSGRPSPIKRAG